MTEECARSILRLIGIVTVMVGLGLALVTLISYVGASKTMGDMQSTLVHVGTYSLVGNLAISGIGLLLFALSSKLAVLVVE